MRLAFVQPQGHGASCRVRSCGIRWWVVSSSVFRSDGVVLPGPPRRAVLVGLSDVEEASCSGV
jgi:hypothetical protein